MKSRDHLKWDNGDLGRERFDAQLEGLNSRKSSGINSVGRGAITLSKFADSDVASLGP